MAGCKNNGTRPIFRGFGHVIDSKQNIGTGPKFRGFELVKIQNKTMDAPGPIFTDFIHVIDSRQTMGLDQIYEVLNFGHVIYSEQNKEPGAQGILSLGHVSMLQYKLKLAIDFCVKECLQRNLKGGACLYLNGQSGSLLKTLKTSKLHSKTIGECR